MFLYMASPQTVNAAMDNTTCNMGNIFVYILSAVCILLLTYAIIKLLIHGWRHFHRYQMTTHFLYEHGHDKGPSSAVALELSTLSAIFHVHIVHVNIPITTLSVHETDHNAYHIVPGNWFYDFLKLSKPIIILHRNGVVPIRTSINFEIGFFQHFKLRCIMHTNFWQELLNFKMDT